MIENHAGEITSQQPPITISRRKLIGNVIIFGGVALGIPPFCDSLSTNQIRKDIDDHVTGLPYPGRQQILESKTEIEQFQKKAEDLIRQNRLAEITQEIDERKVQQSYAVIDQANHPDRIREELMAQHQIDERNKRNIIISLISIGTSIIGGSIVFKDEIVDFFREIKYG